jgi:hypothetical protein
MISFLIWTLIFAGLGIAAIRFEQGGSEWYRSYYDWSHKNSLPESSKEGFLNRQGIRQRMAVTLAFVCVLLSVQLLVFGLNLSVLFALLLGFPAGTYAANKLMSIGGSAAEYARAAEEYIDKAAEGERDVTEDARRAAERAASSAKEQWRRSNSPESEAGESTHRSDTSDTSSDQSREDSADTDADSSSDDDEDPDDPRDVLDNLKR